LFLFFSYNKLSNFIGSTSVLGAIILILGLLCMNFTYINKAEPTNKVKNPIRTPSLIN